MSTLAKRLGMVASVALMVCAVCFLGTAQSKPSTVETNIYKVDIPSSMKVEYISDDDIRFVYDSDNYIDVCVYPDMVFEDICKRYDADWSKKDGYFSCENQFGLQMIDDMVFIYYDEEAYHQATCVPYSGGVLVLEAQSTYDEGATDEDSLEVEYDKTAAFETVFDTIMLVENISAIEP